MFAIGGAWAACSAKDDGPTFRIDGGGRTDGSTGGRDGGDGDTDGGLPPVNSCTPGCGPTELCGSGDGNGLDDNCDGRVDEGCPCAATGTTRPCFAGPPDRRNHGACSDGIETCDEFLQWGPCFGGVSPSSEVCDGTDNDCNGIPDDGVGDCSGHPTCPENGHSAPLSTYQLDGNLVYGGAGSNWTWRIECPMSVPLCPAPSNPNAKQSDVYFTASGAYRVFVEADTDDGQHVNCAWTVYVQGSGLRVELNWNSQQDTAGGTDVDLHLHRWTSNDAETKWFGEEDCFYGNCTPAASGGLGGEINWADHADSPLENCQDAPHGGGARWRTRGSCRNPRLDVDTNGIDGACHASQTDPNQSDFCAPENINVDSPIVGMPYRVMVNYYQDHGFSDTTYPSVNIYCGGALRASLGLDPIVSLRYGTDYGPGNDSWYVADVVFFEGECGTDCMVYPITTGTTRGMPDPSDPFGLTSMLGFGPAWSCRYDSSTMSCTP